MTPLDFLTALWPHEGHYALATPFRIPGTDRTTYAHKVFDTIPEAVAFVEKRKATNDIFFAVHSLAEPRVWNPKKVDPRTGEQGAYEVRVHSNMLSARAFFFDLDVGSDPRKYQSQAEAFDALKAFCRDTALPRPMVTSSGGGLHVYWLISKGLPSTEWQQHAQRLKKLAAHHELRVDPMRTTDVASVLRVAGTYNLKDPENPRKVRVILPPNPIKTADMLSAISSALIRAGETRARSTPWAHARSPTTIWGPTPRRHTTAHPSRSKRWARPVRRSVASPSCAARCLSRSGTRCSS